MIVENIYEKTVESHRSHQIKREHDAFTSLFNIIHAARCITLNQKKIIECLDLIDQWYWLHDQCYKFEDDRPEFYERKEIILRKMENSYS